MNEVKIALMLALIKAPITQAKISAFYPLDGCFVRKKLESLLEKRAC
jgi:hypothetical protein